MTHLAREAIMGEHVFGQMVHGRARTAWTNHGLHGFVRFAHGSEHLARKRRGLADAEQ